MYRALSSNLSRFPSKLLPVLLSVGSYWVNALVHKRARRCRGPASPCWVGLSMCASSHRNKNQTILGNHKANVKNLRTLPLTFVLASSSPVVSWVGLGEAKPAWNTKWQTWRKKREEEPLGRLKQLLLFSPFSQFSPQFTGEVKELKALHVERMCVCVCVC